jgi:hypothetical protein
MTDRLFDIPADVEVPDLSRRAPKSNPSTVGAIAEQEAILELVKRGYPVAVPVVDDEGVDLIVNYRTTVQVKSTSRRHPRGGGYRVGLWSGRNDGKRVSGLRDHVDCLILRVPIEDAWLIVPRAALEAANAYRSDALSFHVHPSGNSGQASALATYRDRWDVFDFPENFA